MRAAIRPRPPGDIDDPRRGASRETCVCAHRYGEIVAVLRATGRDDDAEQWARQGLAEHPSGFQTDRLRDQLVDLLLDGGRAAEAVAVPYRRRDPPLPGPDRDRVERASDKYRGYVEALGGTVGQDELGTSVSESALRDQIARSAAGGDWPDQHGISQELPP